MKKVLFVGHDASRTGAPLLLLRTLRWLREASDLSFEVALLRGGELLADYRALAPTRVVAPRLVPSPSVFGKARNAARGSRAWHAWQWGRLRERLWRGDIGLVFLNSVVSAELVEVLGPPPCRSILWAHECRQLLQTSARTATRAACRDVDEILAVSRAAARDLEIESGCREARTRIIPGFLDTRAIAETEPRGAEVRASLGIPLDALVVGGAGRTGLGKGSDLFLQMAARVCQRAPGRDVHFVWYGPGKPDEDWADCDLRGLGLEGRVHFAGPTDAPGDFHDAFDLFALTSREESFGLVALEAAAHEVPVLCFDDAGGAPEVVGKEMGRIVPYLDVAAMAEAVVELAADPEARARLGAAGAEQVRQRYDVSVVGPQLLARIRAHLDAATPVGSGRVVSGERARPAPVIAPVADPRPRPMWSVMIPTYDASPALLKETLRSVLAQDPGADRMQIALVDDGSCRNPGPALIEQLAPGRIEYFGDTENRGLASSWNACLTWSRGHWVHLLHQDDVVRPGFYAALERAQSDSPDAGAAFCRHVIVDDEGRQQGLSGLERRNAGIVDDWLGRIAGGQRVQCPAMVVRRALYEEIGGFRPELTYALDWEMWIRVAAAAPVWFEPEPLAAYRRSISNESARLSQTAENVTDLFRAAAIALEALPEGRRDALAREARRYCTRSALESAALSLTRGDRDGAWAQVCAVAERDRGPWFWWQILRAARLPLARWWSS